MKNATFFKAFLLTLALITASFMTGMAQPGTAGKAKTLKSSGLAPVNGLKLYYEVHGEGKPIVLLHGSYMTIDLNFGELIPQLAKNRKVIALEMQGHGRTADIDRPVSYKALSDDVAALLKYLKVDSADVLGYSLGGTVAFDLAINHPEMVNKLIAVSTVHKYTGWSQAVRDVLKTIKPEFLDGTPLKTEYDRVAPDPRQWHAFLDKYMKFDQQDFDLGAENIRKIKSPVLLIMGDNDGVDMSYKAELYKLCGGDVFADMQGLPQSQLAIIPGATHVTLMMQTDKLVPVIMPFLNGVTFKMPGM
jgi:pimeloyl-ACP methyl ester carboxylesterase